MGTRFYPDLVGTDSTLLSATFDSGALTLPPKSQRIRPDEVICYVNETDNITSILATGEAMTIARLIFTDTASDAGIVDGSNLKLSADLVYAPNDVLKLVCNGTNWYEISRSVNG